jgi:hypothetical protein
MSVKLIGDLAQIPLIIYTRFLAKNGTALSQRAKTIDNMIVLVWKAELRIGV